jgi:hypothetical protein
MVLRFFLLIKKYIVIIIMENKNTRDKNPLNKQRSVSFDAIKSMEDKIAEDISKLEDKDKIDFDVFFNYLFNDCCGCFEKECDIFELKNNNLNQIIVKYNKNRNLNNLNDLNVDVNTEEKKCNTIRVDIGDTLNEVYKGLNNSSYSKIALVIKFIELFKKSGLIVENQNMYFLLNSNMRFKWNNIKMLTVKDIQEFKNKNGEDIINKLKNEYLKEKEKKNEEQELLIIKSLFWYFRKVVVDSIVSDIIILNGYEKDVKAMSVGSTTLTSDYDITLDGTYNKNSRVIRRFDMFVEVLFMDDSESVFDTNIYGVSFIKGKDTVVETPTGTLNKNSINVVVNKAFESVHEKCGKFNYILSNDRDFIISQHIWAFVKLLLRLKKIQDQDEKLYALCLDELSKKLGDNLYFSSAKQFMNKYESNVNNYEKTVKFASEFLKDVNDENSKYYVSNFISYVNYNGSETYLTNGAFLDVVVNNQMCQPKNIVNLDNNSYLDSFIENLSDLITHYHKKKYLVRAKNAFDKMLEIDKGLKEEIKNDVLKNIEDIRTIQKNCSDDILECQSFLIVSKILVCIIEVFKRYIDWSEIPEENLKESVKRFENLKFKNFKLPIDSIIRKMIKKDEEDDVDEEDDDE